MIARRNKDFILFDDTQPLQVNEQLIVNGTVELKAAFIKKAQLGGVHIHTLDMDDYTGLACHRDSFPVASTVSRLFSNPVRSIPSPPTTTTTTAIPMVKKPNPCAGVINRDLVADENDCQYYFVCMPDHQEPIAHLKCPNDMQFSVKQKACTTEKSVRSSFSHQSYQNVIRLLEFFNSLSLFFLITIALFDQINLEFHQSINAIH